MRWWLCLVIVSRLAALDLGDRAPDLAGATWALGAAPDLTAGTPTALVWSATWCEPGRDLPERLGGLQRRHEMALQVALILRDEADAVAHLAEAETARFDTRLAAAPKALATAWLGDDVALPQAVLIDGDGAVAWIGHPFALEAHAMRLVEGTFDHGRARQVRAAELRLDEAAQANAPDLERILALTAEILAVEPLHPLAIDVRIACAQRLDRPAVARATLTAIPLDQLGAWQACDLATGRIEERDPERRHLDLALTWAAHACRLEPGEARPLATWARALAAIGAMDQAATNARAALALTPQDDEIRALVTSLDEATQLRWTWAPGG